MDAVACRAGMQKGIRNMRIPCRFTVKTGADHVAAPYIRLQPSAPARLHNLCADQFVGLRASFASMHSVAWGTFISRSLGISFPVVLQIP